MFITNTTKITSKGQVTIPKAVRDILGSDFITFEIDDNNKVIINPVRNARGMLSKYKDQIDKIPFEEIRDLAWKRMIDEHYK